MASRMVRESAAQRASAPGRPAAASQRRTADATGPAGAAPPRPDYAAPARRFGSGARRFGRAVFGPLLHTGGTLWLEITGLFFALFALFFVENVVKLRSAWRSGPEHGHLMLYVGLTIVFIYFSATSFLRAAQRGRRGSR